MHRNLLLQGFSNATYADEVRWVLGTPDLQRALISVAFLNQEGVLLLEEELKRFVKEITFYCGIRNDITSYQGVLRLINNGHKVYAVDTGSRGRIFHPKIYYASGTETARISVGSGNLTLGGLNNNIEAGLGLDLNLRDTSDLEFAEYVEAAFASLPMEYPENVIHITDVEKLDQIRDLGTLLDEAEVSPPRPSRTTDRASGTDPVPRIHLPVNLLYPTIRKSRPPKVTNAQKVPPGPAISNVPTNLFRVWQSKPLTERDLNIPSAEVTHPTGSINLDKGLLDEHIDHRHYFRDEVFSGLEWHHRQGDVEETTAIFQLIIKDKYLGDFELLIRHTASTTSTSYLQRNAMTRLSWGEMREFIAKPDYIGRTLTLYSDEANPTKFVIEID